MMLPKLTGGGQRLLLAFAFLEVLSARVGIGQGHDQGEQFNHDPGLTGDGQAKGLF